MKYLPLVWAGLWRKRVRTVLTFISVVLAFVLFGVLNAVSSGIDSIVDRLKDTRLRVNSRVSVVQPMPLAYLARMQQIPGVRRVAHTAFFDSYYQDPKNAIDTSAVDVESYFDVFDEWQLPPEQIQAMKRTRTGAVIGNEVAEKYGWKIGDRLPLRSMGALKEDGSGDWTFDIVGIFHIRDELWPATEVFVNYDYFDEARASGRGNVNQYIVSTQSAGDAEKVAQAIDDMTANSADETRTTPEKIYVGAAFRRLGNVKFMVASISGAALFALLFLTGNTMVQSVRQRIPELAVLKAYGIGDLGLMTLLIAESLILCVGAALVGLLLAAAVFPSVYEDFGLSRVSLPASVVVLGVVCASLLAILSALPPALRIRRLDVADALSRG